MEAVAPCDGPAPNSDVQETPVDMLRIKQQMSNQCFEMAVQLNAGTNIVSCSTLEAERELPDCISELETVKTNHFISTMALHRMQKWHAIGEKLTDGDDEEAQALRAVSERSMALCSRILQLHVETREIQNQVTELQKKRLEMKRLTLEKMKRIEELMAERELPDMEKYKTVLEKGQSNLEKYRKMASMTQNVLRGILLACEINWLDDPNLRGIAMTLEDFPLSD